MMRFVIVVENIKSYYSSANTYDLFFLFEQSTRKCMWECHDGQAKFVDELKGRQVIAWKRGYGPDYVNLFVKHHKNKMREFASQGGIRNPSVLGLTNVGWREGGH